VLLQRRVAIEFGDAGTTGRRLEGLRIAFDVKHSRSAPPSPARVQVWNLSDVSIGALQKPGAVVRLFTGYKDDGVPKLIFVGNPTPTGTKVEQQGSDRIATIELRDGGSRYVSARVDKSFGSRATFAEVFEAAVSALGMPTAGPLPASTSLVTFPSGIHLAGTARDVLDDLAAAAKAHWFIRDGVVYFLERDAGTTETAPVFSSRNGNLVGSATRTEDNGIELRALLDPAMRPGRPFRVESRGVTGNYVARDVRFIGDSGFDTPFYVEITGRPLGADRQGTA
jgi:hypothetical protein